MSGANDAYRFNGIGTLQGAVPCSAHLLVVLFDLKLPNVRYVQKSLSGK